MEGLRKATEADAAALAELLQTAYRENEKLGVEYNPAAVTEGRDLFPPRTDLLDLAATRAGRS